MAAPYVPSCIPDFQGSHPLFPPSQWFLTFCPLFPFSRLPFLWMRYVSGTGRDRAAGKSPAQENWAAVRRGVAGLRGKSGECGTWDLGTMACDQHQPYVSARCKSSSIIGPENGHVPAIALCTVGIWVRKSIRSSYCRVPTLPLLTRLFNPSSLIRHSLNVIDHRIIILGVEVSEGH